MAVTQCDNIALVTPAGVLQEHKSHDVRMLLETRCVQGHTSCLTNRSREKGNKLALTHPSAHTDNVSTHDAALSESIFDSK